MLYGWWQAGEIERALAISKMQGVAATQRSSMLGWLRGGIRRRPAAAATAGMPGTAGTQARMPAPLRKT
jgi:hypothetical protein